VKTNCLRNSISLLVSVICLTFIISCAEEQQEEHFYFVQITDTHFEDSDNMERTRRVVERINDLPMAIRCVVHTGDITTDELENKTLVDSGLSILEQLTVPIHYVPGNHDIIPSKLESTTKAYLENFGGLLSRAETSITGSGMSLCTCHLPSQETGEGKRPSGYMNTVPVRSVIERSIRISG
jgi:calcineurin-like phosphoesterase family protein